MILIDPIGGIYMLLIGILYQRWDDHSQYDATFDHGTWSQFWSPEWACEPCRRNSNWRLDVFVIASLRDLHWSFLLPYPIGVMLRTNHFCKGNRYIHPSRTRVQLSLIFRVKNETTRLLQMLNWMTKNFFLAILLVTFWDGENVTL